jgi:hypothetical protein
VAENETAQNETELTPEQKKVLGQVYRLILSWDCETPESIQVHLHESQSIEKSMENPVGKPSVMAEIAIS